MILVLLVVLVIALVLFPTLRCALSHLALLALCGVKGYMRLSMLPEEMLAALLAGEILHIGKNTSFGFGRYRVK